VLPATGTVHSSTLSPSASLQGPGLRLQLIHYSGTAHILTHRLHNNFFVFWEVMISKLSWKVGHPVGKFSGKCRNSVEKHTMIASLHDITRILTL